MQSDFATSLIYKGDCMTEKIKKTSKRFLVVPVVTLSLIAILVLANVDRVNAQNQVGVSAGDRGGFAEVLANKFNLDQTEVQETIHEFHKENHQERVEKRVAESLLTETQRYAVLEKFEEMHNQLEDLHDQDLSHDEIHELRADIHEEMEAWAESEGINLELFLQAGKNMFY